MGRKAGERDYPAFWEDVRLLPAIVGFMYTGRILMTGQIPPGVRPFSVIADREKEEKMRAFSISFALAGY